MVYLGLIPILELLLREGLRDFDDARIRAGLFAVEFSDFLIGLFAVELNDFLIGLFALSLTDFLTDRLLEPDCATLAPGESSASVPLRTFLIGLPVLLLEKDFFEILILIEDAKLLLLLERFSELFPELPTE